MPESRVKGANRLVKVQASEDSGAVIIQTAEFDGRGRRIKKGVESSGQADGTAVYLYVGQKIIETRDGSGNLYQQVIHGTRYIDEVVMVRVKDKGDLYVHQDANWNVIGLTDLGGSLVERHVYRPYGQLTVNQETGYGDRDGDGDVDATDKGTPGSTCTGTVSGACRILDLDFDGDYDSADATLFEALPQGLMRHPGRIATNVHQPFGHQGLLFDPEIVSYHNRARQYDPTKRRFLQRDALVIRAAAGGGYADGANLYQYVRSGPIGRLDPTGRFCIWTLESTEGPINESAEYEIHETPIPCPPPETMEGVWSCTVCRLVYSEVWESFEMDDWSETVTEELGTCGWANCGELANVMTSHTESWEWKQEQSRKCFYRCDCGQGEIYPLIYQTPKWIIEGWQQEYTYWFKSYKCRCF